MHNYVYWHVQIILHAGDITTTSSHSEPTSTPGIDSTPSNDGKNQDNSGKLSQANDNDVHMCIYKW